MKNICIRGESPWDEAVFSLRVGFNQEYHPSLGDSIKERFLLRGSFDIFEKDGHYVSLVNKRDGDEELVFGVNDLPDLDKAKKKLIGFARDYASEINQEYHTRKGIDLKIIEDLG